MIPVKQEPNIKYEELGEALLEDAPPCPQPPPPPPPGGARVKQEPGEDVALDCDPYRWVDDEVETGDDGEKGSNLYPWDGVDVKFAWSFPQTSLIVTLISDQKYFGCVVYMSEAPVVML